MPESVDMASKYATVDDLTARVEHPTRDVTLPNGKVVKVRGLTRAELIAGGQATEDPAEVERRNVAVCLLAPRMTVAEVRRWQKLPGSVAALAAISNAIRDLSGLGEGAQKSDVDQARDGA
jgi:hypothetical protein